MAGSLNWAVCATFDDGIEWIFRSPRLVRHTIAGEESALKMPYSEASTLKCLSAYSTISSAGGLLVMVEILIPS